MSYLCENQNTSKKKERKQLGDNAMHQFNINVAIKYGPHAAIIINNFAFWQQKNQANKKNWFDGHYWTYNSMDALAELLPYFSKDQIKRILKKLEDENAIKVGNYNRLKMDRTKWYTIIDECIGRYYTLHMAKSPNASGGIASPIPDSKPDNKRTDNNTSCVNKYSDAFEVFWKAYLRPGKGVKSDAYACYKKLTDEEKIIALNGIVPYSKIGSELIHMQHAERYLKNKMWEGLSDDIANPDSLVEEKYNYIINGLEKNVIQRSNINFEIESLRDIDPALAKKLIAKIKGHPLIEKLKRNK